MGKRFVEQGKKYRLPYGDENFQESNIAAVHFSYSIAGFYSRIKCVLKIIKRKAEIIQHLLRRLPAGNNMVLGKVADSKAIFIRSRGMFPIYSYRAGFGLQHTKNNLEQ